MHPLRVLSVPPAGAVWGASLSSSGAEAPRPEAESFYCIPGSQAAHSEGAQKCLWENNGDPKMNTTIRALRAAQSIQWPPSKSEGSECLPTSCSSGGFPSLSRENSRSFGTTCRAPLSLTTSQSKLLLLTEKNATSHYNRNFSQRPTEFSLVVLSLAGDLNPQSNWPLPAEPFRLSFSVSTCGKRALALTLVSSPPDWKIPGGKDFFFNHACVPSHEHDVWHI